MIRVVLDTFNQGGWIMAHSDGINCSMVTGLMKLYELWSLEGHAAFLFLLLKGIRISSELVRQVTGISTG